MSDPDSAFVLFRRASGFRHRRRLREFATTLRRQLAPGKDFVCLVTDDQELRRLNRQFLGKDYPTDVLSFPSGGRSGALGEIAISWQRAADQARSLGHGQLEEACILMLHGVLHLLGMDHETDRGRMRRAETAWRRKLGLPPGLIERSRA